MYYAVFFGSSLPIWIFQAKNKHALLAAFDSPEAKIQKPEARSIWHQANNLRSVVRYLENTLRCQLYPRYKRTGASSLLRLGYHPRLIGGISSRPSFSDAALLMENLSNYSSLANQTYPLNVWVEMPLVSSKNECTPPYTPLPFATSQNLYQRVKKCIRSKQPLHIISISSLFEVWLTPLALMVVGMVFSTFCILVAFFTYLGYPAYVEGPWGARVGVANRNPFWLVASFAMRGLLPRSAHAWCAQLMGFVWVSISSTSKHGAAAGQCIQIFSTRKEALCVRSIFNFRLLTSATSPKCL